MTCQDGGGKRHPLCNGMSIAGSPRWCSESASNEMVEVARLRAEVSIQALISRVSVKDVDVWSCELRNGDHVAPAGAGSTHAVEAPQILDLIQSRPPCGDGCTPVSLIGSAKGSIIRRRHGTLRSTCESPRVEGDRTHLFPEPVVLDELAPAPLLRGLERLLRVEEVRSLSFSGDQDEVAANSHIEAEPKGQYLDGDPWPFRNVVQVLELRAAHGGLAWAAGQRGLVYDDSERGRLRPLQYLLAPHPGCSTACPIRPLVTST